VESAIALAKAGGTPGKDVIIISPALKGPHNSRDLFCPYRARQLLYRYLGFHPPPQSFGGLYPRLLCIAAPRREDGGRIESRTGI